MTMQSVPTNGHKPYTPHRTPQRGRSGNYHRIHDAILERADKDGVFRTGKAIEEIIKVVDASYSSVASSVFQWSDPTGKLGVRRVRLYSPRNKASDPPEMPTDTTALKDKTGSTSWAKGVFPPPPSTNKNGPFYLKAGVKSTNGVRRGDQIREQISVLAKTLSDEDGLWPLARMVQEMANLGFPAPSVYKHINREVAAGRIKRRGGRRMITSFKVDPLSDPNSFKGPKTDRMIEQERGINTEVANDKPEGIPTGDKAAALDALITQLIQRKLEQPETLSLIDTFIKARIEEVIRKQLGL